MTLTWAGLNCCTVCSCLSAKKLPLWGLTRTADRSPAGDAAVGPPLSPGPFFTMYAPNAGMGASACACRGRVPFCGLCRAGLRRKPVLCHRSRCMYTSDHANCTVCTVQQHHWTAGKAACMHEDRWLRTHQFPFLGKLLQLLHINLLRLGYGIVLRGISGRLQLERVLAIYLLPVDGAIRAVDGLMPELQRDTTGSQGNCCTSFQGHLWVLQQFIDTEVISNKDCFHWPDHTWPQMLQPLGCQDGSLRSL